VFVPIFFVGVGLEADLFALTPGNVALLAGFQVIAVVSKIIGAGLAGLLARFSPRESLQLGMSMVPRGEVVLIVATVGITEGFISQAELSVTVALVVLTTLMTPPVLRWLFREQAAGETQF
jgi:Kef-type K+ transport system membrane component KefB